MFFIPHTMQMLQTSVLLDWTYQNGRLAELKNLTNELTGLHLRAYGLADL